MARKCQFDIKHGLPLHGSTPLPGVALDSENRILRDDITHARVLAWGPGGNFCPGGSQETSNSRRLQEAPRSSKRRWMQEVTYLSAQMQKFL